MKSFVAFYNHPVEVEESFNYAVTLHGSINKGLHDFNKEFYGKRIDRYYKLRINDRTLINQFSPKCEKCDSIFNRPQDLVDHISSSHI